MINKGIKKGKLSTYNNLNSINNQKKQVDKHTGLFQYKKHLPFY